MNAHFEWIDEKPTNGAGSLAGFEWLGAPPSGTLGAAVVTAACLEAQKRPACKIDWSAYVTAQMTVINGGAGIMLPDGTQPGTADYAIKIGIAQGIFTNLSNQCANCGKASGAVPGLRVPTTTSACLDAQNRPECKIDWASYVRAQMTVINAKAGLILPDGTQPGAANYASKAIAAQNLFDTLSGQCADCGKVVGPTTCAEGYEGTPPNCVKKVVPVPPTTGTMKSGMSAGGIFLLASMALGGMYAAWKYGGTSQSRAA